MKFSCKENCKKTSQLRGSEHCTGLCSIDDNKLKFDCDESISKLSQADVNFNTCSFWDMSIKEMCFKCPLDCKENKNPNVLKTKVVVKNISSILESIVPLAQMNGIDPVQIKKAYDTLNSSGTSINNSKDIENTIQITNYAKDILNNVMSGKNIDIAEFKKVKELLEIKYGKK